MKGTGLYRIKWLSQYIFKSFKFFNLGEIWFLFDLAICIHFSMFLTVILRHPEVQIKTQEEPKSVVMQLIFKNSLCSCLWECGTVEEWPPDSSPRDHSGEQGWNLMLRSQQWQADFILKQCAQGKCHNVKTQPILEL